MKSDTRLLRVTRENSSRASSLDQQVRIAATVVILLDGGHTADGVLVRPDRRFSFSPGT
jgi:hypothetical protein